MGSSVYCVVLLMSLSSCLFAADKECSIQRFGKLTLFNGESYRLELPCNYRLADVTCGDFWAVVNARSSRDGVDNNRFTPDYVRVRVKAVSGANRGEFFVFQTSLRQLKKAIRGKVANPWSAVKGPATLAADQVEYDGSKMAAVLRKGGLEVEFREKDSSSSRAGVVVRCLSDRTFSSTGIHRSLCGSMTRKELKAHKTSLFGCGTRVTDRQTLHYLVLNDDRIGHSTTCSDIATRFQACQFQENAVTRCAAIFSDRLLSACLANDTSTALETYYDNCLKFACDADAAANTPLRNFVASKCPGVLACAPKDVCF